MNSLQTQPQSITRGLLKSCTLIYLLWLNAAMPQAKLDLFDGSGFLWALQMHANLDGIRVNCSLYTFSNKMLFDKQAKQLYDGIIWL